MTVREAFTSGLLVGLLVAGTITGVLWGLDNARLAREMEQSVSRRNEMRLEESLNLLQRALQQMGQELNKQQEDILL